MACRGGRRPPSGAMGPGQTGFSGVLDHERNASDNDARVYSSGPGGCSVRAPRPGRPPANRGPSSDTARTCSPTPSDPQRRSRHYRLVGRAALGTTSRSGADLPTGGPMTAIQPQDRRTIHLYGHGPPRHEPLVQRRRQDAEQRGQGGHPGRVDLDGAPAYAVERGGRDLPGGTHDHLGGRFIPRSSDRVASGVSTNPG